MLWDFEPPLTSATRPDAVDGPKSGRVELDGGVEVGPNGNWVCGVRGLGGNEARMDDVGVCQ